MTNANQSENSRPVPPPDIETSNETNAVQHPRGRGKIRRFLGKVTNGAIKSISRSNLKGSRSRRDPVPSNVDREGASSTPNIENAPSGTNQSIDPQLALQTAKDAVEGMKLLSGPVTSAASVAQNTPADLEDACNFEDTYLKPLRIFDSVIDKLSNVHPYAKVVLGLLSSASKIVLAQSDRDQGILRLLEKLGQVYDFMMQDSTLGGIPSMQGIVGRIVQQTLECSQFIKDYSATKNFWQRLGKNVISEAENTTQQYINVLDALMQSFRDQATRDVEIFVHRTGEILDLSGMVYAEGAGRDTGKQCLPGTRTEIISEITDWINSTEDNVQRVLWLSGPAGKGKSAIAHTIANLFNDVGGLGSCFCFDHQRDADHRHDKIFSTIARDLADRDPEMRRALAEAVKDKSSLKTTADIVQQWDELLMKPLGKPSGSIVRPVVILIEALDESGGVKTRSRLLQILAGKLGAQRITELPANFRIIITSRLLRDIEAELAGAQHIKRMSMDDISSLTAERDIHTYVSKELGGLSEFGDREYATLAKQADGLFEWARLACESIKAPPAGSSPIESFHTVMSRSPVDRARLLDDIYQLILTKIIPKDKSTPTASRDRQLARFRSVMGQILGAAEPLSLESLNVMRKHFPDVSEHYKVQVMVEHMGPLLSGTTDSSTPIRPLHASFRDFLTDPECSGEFFVDVSKVQRDLAFASLGVMKDGLSFNICGLKSSYLPNSEVPELQERVEKHIPPHLSYACRFWPVHVKATDFDTKLAEEIKSFFDHERMFFWIEVLCLINALSGAVHALPVIAKWLKGHTGYEDASSAAMDVQRFIQVFGGIILHSTPHLYVSALPFSPVNSALSKTFSARFPNSLRVASGRDINWTAVQTVISGHTSRVNSVSFSPDGTRIATGSDDRTVRLWDAATGQPVGEPLLGHTESVASVSFSPDGTCIASGSYDKTVRLWDVATWQPVGDPLCGHTSRVLSVSFSPNGTRIVTGSADETVQLWDVAMRQPIGEPLRGHTDWVNSVSFSPDETRIVSGSDDHTVRLWEVVTGQPAGEPLLGHTSSVTSVSFSPDGTRIATSSADCTVRLWNAATGKLVCEPLEQTDWVRSVSFSPDGSRIVTGSDDGTVRLWDPVTGKPVGEPLLGHTDDVLSVSFSPDGTRIATGSEDCTVRLWDASTGRPISEPLQGHAISVTSVSLSPDGTRFATGYWDGTVRLLDAATGQPVGEPLLGHTEWVQSVSFSPDGTRIATGSADGSVRLWDAGTGQLVGEPLVGHCGGVHSVSFLPDGTRIATGSEDGSVRLWDAGTGQLVGEPLLGHSGAVNPVSFSPDGTRIVSGSNDGTVQLWDVGTGQPVGEPLEGHTARVTSVSFSPDGTRIASGSDDKTVRLWEVATGQSVSEPLDGHTDWVMSVSFSPDGTRIVTGSADKTVRLWNAATGKPVCEPLEGHTSWVRSVSFSPDGTRVVSGSDDSTIRLWDAGTGQPVGAPLWGHSTIVTSVTFSRDGARIISYSYDGTVRVWYAVIGKSLQDHAEDSCSASSLHGSNIPCPTAVVTTPNTVNDNFISFSSDLTHALHDTAELLEGAPHNDRRSTFAFLGEDGWMMGPNDRLLFWVPPASREPFYNPQTALVIPRGGVELDLSRMAHGTRWQHCYKYS